MAFDQTLTIDVPDKLVPVFLGPARVRGAFGGRGSGKTRSFAKMAAVQGARFAQAGREGIILCAREYMNSLDDSSMAEVKAAISSDAWLTSVYDVGEKYIRTRCGRVHFSFIGLRHNLDSIKSKAMILLCWVDEAEPVSETAWSKLFPTVREDGSEIWVTWNPERKGSDTDKRFRRRTDDDMKVVEINWRDNPWFPDVLEGERKRDERDRPEQYEHVWGGDYVQVSVGAYYAKQLLAAKNEGRIRRLARDPLMSIRTWHDIGGAGAKADLYSIVVGQTIDDEIRVLDHYSSRGQSLGHHVEWMRKRGYEGCEVILPHDGTNANNVTGKRYEDHWRDARFSVKVVPNQGMGAASQRIEASRRWFPRIWFNNGPGVDASGAEIEDCTETLRYSLGRYAPKIGESGNDLGPDHNEYSHDADAFGLMNVDYRGPDRRGADKPLQPRIGTMA